VAAASIGKRASMSHGCVPRRDGLADLSWASAPILALGAGVRENGARLAAYRQRDR
jgi:hypothetical protein